MRPAYLGCDVLVKSKESEDNRKRTSPLHVSLRNWRTAVSTHMSLIKTSTIVLKPKVEGTGRSTLFTVNYEKRTVMHLKQSCWSSVNRPEHGSILTSLRQTPSRPSSALRLSSSTGAVRCDVCVKPPWAVELGSSESENEIMFM